MLLQFSAIHYFTVFPLWRMIGVSKTILSAKSSTFPKKYPATAQGSRGGNRDAGSQSIIRTGLEPPTRMMSNQGLSLLHWLVILKKGWHEMRKGVAMKGVINVTSCHYSAMLHCSYHY
jgi:hypothetical protein